MFRSFLTGSDNETLAIGRVLGVALFLLFLIGFPALVAGVLLEQKESAKIWFEYFGVLQIYVPLIIASAAGMIAGTAFTEPKPKDPPTS